MTDDDLLREFLSYDPGTGVFRWIKTRSSRIMVGDVAGSYNADGYWQINFGKKLYLGHRLAVFLMTGRWPEHTVDHRDRNKSNNRWENLREASYSQNSANMVRRPNNTSGRKGVFFGRNSKRPFAQIMVNRKSIHLGTFDTVEEASAAYETAATKYFGEFARSA